MLQVKSNLRSICFNLGQFDFFLFLWQTKKIFLAPSIFSSSSFFSLSHSTYLTYYSLPALQTSQPLFFLSQCLHVHVPCEPWTTYLWFSYGFMSWCLTIEPWRLGCKFHYFFNNIYSIYSSSNKFPKLFKSDILINENTCIPPIITVNVPLP